MIPTLLGIPFDAASSFLRGAAAGPAAIRAALHSPSSNLWTESLRDLGAPGALADAGDVALSPSDWRGPVEQAVEELAARGRRVIALGGDHAVSYPLIRATARAHGAFSVLHLDAHPDLYPEFEGDRYSHACPFARVMEEGLAERLVQVGIRTMNGVQQAQAERYGVEVIDMRAWSGGRRPDVRGAVYLSIDLDVVDPAFAPGVSHREPGGLTAREVIDLIQRVAGPIVGADIVELNPSRDPAEITAPLAAKLVKELAARMLGDAA